MKTDEQILASCDEDEVARWERFFRLAFMADVVITHRSYSPMLERCVEIDSQGYFIGLVLDRDDLRVVVRLPDSVFVRVLHPSKVRVV